MSGDSRDRIRTVLETVLGVPKETITGEARLDELAALDREFGVLVPGEELTTSLRVAELEAIVETARGA